MTRLITLCAAMLLLVCATMVGARVDATGNTPLAQNHEISHFLEGDNGIPEFVSGKLESGVTKGSEVTAAINFFEKNKAAYRMQDPAKELVVQRVYSDQLGMQHVRLNQHYQGVRVEGGKLLAHYRADGTLETVNGFYLPDIDLETRATVTATSAASLAGDDLESFFGEGRPGESELIVFPWDGEYFLAWKLTLWSETPMGRWEYFVNAKTGDVIFKANRIQDSEEIGTGNGVMFLPRTHLDTWYDGSEYQMIDYTRQANNNIHGHNGQMPDGNYIQTNYASSSLPGAVATDPDNTWDSYSPQSAAVDAHTYTSLVYDWLLAEFGRNSFDDAGASMLSSVNYSAEGDNNAYWNGIQMVVWSFSSGNRSLAGCPDVIAHEWGHAVTDYSSDLVYQKESGALNESFSDMMGAAFEFAHDSMDTPDWWMAENYSVESNGFRNMADPTLRYDPDIYETSPYWTDVQNCTPQYSNDFCGVHSNSGVGNKWFYLLSDGGSFNGEVVTGIGVENAMQIAYRANVHYWTDYSTYGDAAYGTVLAANDLDPGGAWAAQVANAWNAVGVTIPPPALLFSYAGPMPEFTISGSSTVVGVQLTAQYGGQIVPGSVLLHYSVTGAAEETIVATETKAGSFSATLPAVSCGDSLTFYFSAEETVSGVFYEPDPGTPHALVPYTDILPVASEDLSADPSWTTEGDWAYGQPTGGGALNGLPDPTSGYTGDNVYGYALTGAYTDNMPERHLTSKAFDCTGQSHVRLQFWRWLGVETSLYDHAYVRVSNDGVTWVTVWENEDEITDAEWIPMDLDISEVADDQSTVYLRWTMGATDGAWRTCGWNIDDVQLVSYTCGPPPCCIGDVGNVALEPDCDPSDQAVDVSDLTNLIDHLFIGYAPVCCPEEADVSPAIEGQPADGAMDVSDLTALIDHLFIGYSPMPACE